MFRRSLTSKFRSLRISAHSLMIDQGRHIKITLENRTCKLCELNEVEDENTLHDVPIIDKMMSDIAALSVNVDYLSEKDELQFLMSEISTVDFQ